MKQPRAPRSRLAHPDDALRRLARGSRPPIGPSPHDLTRRDRDAPKPWWVLGVVAVIGLLALVIGVPLSAGHNRITVTGIRDGESITKDRLQKNLVQIRISPASEMRKAKLRIDGTPLRVLEEGDSLRWLAPKLQDGEHRLSIQSGTRVLWRGAASTAIRFTVDSQPPTLEIEQPAKPLGLNESFVLNGSVEKGATVLIDGKEVKTDDGHFSKTYKYPPIGQVDVVAVDEAGNRTTASRTREIAFPVVRGLHVSAEAWANPSLKLGVLRMAEAGRINTVVLDVKDENGMVLYDSALQAVLASRASANLYDLRDAVAELHSLGLRVIGRLVVFRDPILAQSSMAVGNATDVVRGLDGTPYQSADGVFTNPFSKSVHDYNIAIAKEGAEAGIDAIVFDYVSRPTGALTEMIMAGSTAAADGTLDASIDETMVEFLRRAARGLSGTPTRMGVALFGQSVISPASVGQNPITMSSAVDFVAPIVFPSRFRAGSFGIATPSLNPATVVTRALTRFKDRVAPSGAAIVPWLQDFSNGPFIYGQKELKAQVTAVKALGIDSFLVWDPKVTYSAAGFPADAPDAELASRVTTSTGPAPTAATIAGTAAPS